MDTTDNARKFAGNLKVVSATIRDLYLNISVSFHMKQPVYAIKIGYNDIETSSMASDNL
jgi:hypothetical protein